MLGPLIAKPFISSPHDMISTNLTNVASNVLNVSVSQSDFVINGTVMPKTALTSDERPAVEGEVNITSSACIWIPYTVGSLLSLLSCISFIFLLLFAIFTRTTGNSKYIQGVKLSSPDCLKILLMCLMLVFVCSCMLWQAGTYSYTYSYVTLYLKWTREEAVYLNTGYWLSLATGRLLGIFTIRYLSPAKLIYIGSITVVVSALVMHFFAEQAHIVMWASTVVMVLGMAPLLGASLTWLDQHIQVQGLVGSSIFLAMVFGEGIGPLFIGRMTAYCGYVVYTYFLICNGALLLMTKTVMQVLTTICIEKRDHARDTIDATNCDHIVSDIM